MHVSPYQQQCNSTGSGGDTIHPIALLLDSCKPEDLRHRGLSVLLLLQVLGSRWLGLQQGQDTVDQRYLRQGAALIDDVLGDGVS